MKKKYLLIVCLLVLHQLVYACDACDKKQPAITRGITHGTGPDSNWDWVIVSVIAAITLLTFIYSLKYLIRPGEKNNSHIKNSILNSI